MCPLTLQWGPAPSSYAHGRTFTSLDGVVIIISAVDSLRRVDTSATRVN